jgi:hypothetical protein
MIGWRVMDSLPITPGQFLQLWASAVVVTFRGIELGSHGSAARANNCLCRAVFTVLTIRSFYGPK